MGISVLQLLCCKNSSLDIRALWLPAEGNQPFTLQEEIIRAFSAPQDCVTLEKMSVSFCRLCRDCKALPSPLPCSSKPSALLSLHPSTCQSSSRMKSSLSVPNSIITCNRLISMESLQRGTRKQTLLTLTFCSNVLIKFRERTYEILRQHVP